MGRSGVAILIPVFAIFSNFCVFADEQLPGRSAGKGIVVGLEYAPIDNPRVARALARAYAETGMPGMKHYPAKVQWGEMQKGPAGKIDFTYLDLFVREYQNNGFTELTICLKPHSPWGSKHAPGLGKQTNASPKDEYKELFEKWIFAVVERYDGDGVNDMPGLRWPVRYIEIGSEFSSYQPEPVGEYLETLRIAYNAAHRASGDVMVGHAPFLITPVNLDVKNPKDYEKAWATTKLHDTHHGLRDQRAILDHPQVFDFINIHNLGNPYEIEHIVRWLKYETGRRGYTKPIVISDTAPTSYIGWGAATSCRGPNLGLASAPASEADRCRLAAYFQKLVNKDHATLAWTRGFIAADHVQRTTVAAEQGIKLINLAFTVDLPLMTLPIGRAAAGIAAWGGAVDFKMGQAKVTEKYPLFYAVKQLMENLNGYDSIERVDFPNDQARVYHVMRRGKEFWIAWRDPKAVLIPEDGEPGVNITLQTRTPSVTVEPVITRMGQTTPERKRVEAPNGAASLTLTHTPIYVFAE